jgi:hypothetical protein
VALDREQLRKLCHGLLLEEGVGIENFRSTGEYDEFTITWSTSWRAHRSAVRIFHRPLSQDDLERAVVDARNFNAVEALLLGPHEIPDNLSPPVGVHMIAPQELADRITSSPLVEWNDGVPSLSTTRLGLVLDLNKTSALLDPIGIRWLPSLAFNELPTALLSSEVEPQDLFERKAFRIFTASFRFGGVRYGEAERGQRVPDSVLFWPNGSSECAMVDCKAASSGYRMESDHVLRFIGYWENMTSELRSEGRILEYLVIVSSYFPGTDGERHPYHGRAHEIEEKTGLKLVYLTASDLAWTSAQVEAGDMPLAERSRLDWRKLFDAGMPNSTDFTTLIEEAH